MFVVRFVLLVSCYLGITGGYVFLGCFSYNKTVTEQFAESGEYKAKNLSASSCFRLCQNNLNFTTSFALADTRMCYCDRNVTTFMQLGKVDNERCRNYCQQSLNDTIYCGDYNFLAVYDADGKGMPEPPTKCKPLNEPENGNFRYDLSGIASIECHDGYSPSSNHTLMCQETNDRYSWNGTLECVSNGTEDEKNSKDGANPAIIIGIVCGVIVFSAVATGVIFFLLEKKKRASSFEIRPHSIKRLRPAIERVEGDGRHSPHTENDHFDTSQQQQPIVRSDEEMHLEPMLTEQAKADFDRPPIKPIDSPENFANYSSEQPLDRNDTASSYNYVKRNSIVYGYTEGEGEDDEEYDLPTMDDTTYESDCCTNVLEGMHPEPKTAYEPEAEPECSQIVMNIDMATVHAPSYSRVSKGREEKEHDMRSEIPDIDHREGEEPEDFYLEPNM